MESPGACLGAGGGAASHRMSGVCHLSARKGRCVVTLVWKDDTSSTCCSPVRLGVSWQQRLELAGRLRAGRRWKQRCGRSFGALPFQSSSSSVRACCLSAASRPLWDVWQWESEGVCHPGDRRWWPAGRFALCRLREGRTKAISAGPQ